MIIVLLNLKIYRVRICYNRIVCRFKNYALVFKFEKPQYRKIEYDYNDTADGFLYNKLWDFGLIEIRKWNKRKEHQNE